MRISHGKCKRATGVRVIGFTVYDKTQWMRGGKRVGYSVLSAKGTLRDFQICLTSETFFASS